MFKTMKKHGKLIIILIVIAVIIYLIYKHKQTVASDTTPTISTGATNQLKSLLSQANDTVQSAKTVANTAVSNPITVISGLPTWKIV